MTSSFDHAAGQVISTKQISATLLMARHLREEHNYGWRRIAKLLNESEKRLRDKLGGWVDD